MPSADTKTRSSPESVAHNATNPPDGSAKSGCSYRPYAVWAGAGNTPLTRLQLEPGSLATVGWGWVLGVDEDGPAVLVAEAVGVADPEAEETGDCDRLVP